MNCLRRFWNWLVNWYNEPKYEGVIVAKTPSGSEPPTPQPKLRQKPRKAIHQNYGWFFKGKGARPHKVYRRSVKAKIQPDD